MKNLQLFLLIMIVTLIASSCKKYLDAKPDSKLFVPQTLDDYQTLLDNSNNMNRQVAWSGEGSSDDSYILNDYWSYLEYYQQNVYVWANQSIPDAVQNDWSLTYLPVYYANIVLEGLQQIAPDETNRAQWNNVEGSALLFRSKYFFDAVLLWAKAYDKNTAATDPGIPLRLSSDFNGPSYRSGIKECYQRIINDLEESATLLPVTPLTVMRPSKTAAYALLARTYLSMQEYDSALVYSNKCLALKNDLIDYNSLDSNAPFPIPQFNREVIMDFTIPGNIWWLNYTIDSSLAQSYAANDLRRSVFFLNPGWAGIGETFRGTYEGSYNLFFGLATDEMYLTRAECYARKSNLPGALNDLNTLLLKRWKTGSFTPVTAVNADALLDKILLERRKELLIRGIRWMDLKRLNKEGANIIVTRNINNQIFSLLPNDNRYALPIPDVIISLTGMQQNPR